MITRAVEKDPNNIEPYFVIWCDEDGGNDGGVHDNGELQGASIVSVAWTVPPGITEVSHNQSGVTIHGVTYAANSVATIWLSGGTVDNDYELTCRITTNDSPARVLDKSFIVPVRSL